ncbi:MAG TPA: cytochrome c [Hyphomicrobiales bacterium]|nr:cytochrome c [Rhodobiaceae bacterium]HXK53323.1 cytochrome c [Hyphomicrobiales bacterium]
MNLKAICTALGAAVLGGGLFSAALLPSRAGAAQDEIKVPQLAGEALAGATLFTRYCASCHGAVAGGTDKGPPLIHRIYEPNHHADFSFVMAARQGVRAHHWKFGNMPPVEGIHDEDVIKIIAFVRAVQKENGIF